MPNNPVETRQDTASSSRANLDRNLDRQYGNIGISAVAAALPYQGEGKNPAYAPNKSVHDEGFVPAI